MRLTAAAIALCVAAIASAQQPYIETFEVRLHNLDVVVTDKAGQPVLGLTKDDFVVHEDGRVQPITNFTAYASGAPPPSTTTPGADAPASSPPPPRRYAFFIDDVSIPLNARTTLLENTLTFVRGLREGDVATVIRPIGKQRILQEPTSDRGALESALTRAVNTMRLRLTAAPEEELRALDQDLGVDDGADSALQGEWARRSYAERVRRRVEQRLGQLRALVASMAGVEGKKVVVLVTSALTATPGSDAYDLLDRALPGGIEGKEGQPPSGFNVVIFDLSKQIDEVARLAASNGVTIYAIEPHVTVSERYDERARGSATTLASLTEKTGGRWFRGTPFIDDTLQQVATDLSAYYSLAYRAQGKEGTARRVEVKVRNRPDLIVRTRTDVFEKTVEGEMADLVVASLLYPRTVNELAVQATAGKPIRDHGFYRVPVDVMIPLDRMTFLPAGRNKYAASFSFHFAAAGERYDFGTGGRQEQKIEITSEQYRERAQTVYRYQTVIQVAPGPVRIAVGVLDEVSRLTGFRTMDVIAK